MWTSTSTGFDVGRSPTVWSGNFTTTWQNTKQVKMFISHFECHVWLRERIELTLIKTEVLAYNHIGAALSKFSSNCGEQCSFCCVPECPWYRRSNQRLQVEFLQISALVPCLVLALNVVLYLKVCTRMDLTMIVEYDVECIALSITLNQNIHRTLLWWRNTSESKQELALLTWYVRLECDPIANWCG